MNAAQAVDAKKQQGRRPPEQEFEDLKNTFPKVEYDAPEPSDPVERTKRRNKGKHFDKLGAISREPTRYSSGLVSEWDLGLPALPAAKSDAVLIGKTASRKAFLSNDKGAVYTEVSVEVEDVLKRSDDSLTNGSVIDVHRLGGVVHYRTGEESLFLIVGQNMPSVGRRYVFFLKALPDSQDFEIMTAYELTPSGVSALDSPSQFKYYNGSDEATFRELVRRTIAQQNH